MGPPLDDQDEDAEGGQRGAEPQHGDGDVVGGAAYSQRRPPYSGK